MFRVRRNHNDKNKNKNNDNDDNNDNDNDNNKSVYRSCTRTIHCPTTQAGFSAEQRRLLTHGAVVISKGRLGQFCAKACRR